MNTKKKIKNKLYNIDIVKLKENVDSGKFIKYKFKNIGYLVLHWKSQGDELWNWHGFITPAKLKEVLGEKQWGKFCKGKRDFIIQKRVNKQNKK